MPKQSKKQLQDDEQKIIQELLRDSSQNINAIADKLGFSRQKVWRVIKNLEKNHTI
jgi:DNA-binding Lrp family transcriptional regulator